MDANPFDTSSVPEINPFDVVLSPETIGPTPCDEQSFCGRCQRVLPGSEFRNRLETGRGRESVCKECLKENPGKKSQKRKRIEQGIHRLLAATQQETVDVPTISRLASGLVKELGGVDSVIQQWATQIRAAKDGSKTKLDQYQFVFKMLAQVAQDRREELDVTKLSEEELERAIEGYALRILNPEDVAGDDGEDMEQEAAEVLDRVKNVG